MVLLEKWKRSVDRGKTFGALLTDLSKVFDCLDRELLIAKLNAYGLSLPALRLIHDYLSNRKQRTKINCSYSEWLEIVFGVPQGSILGPLLFNKYLADLFYIMDDMIYYANNNTAYVTADDIDGVVSSLENSSNTLFKWFSDNLFKGNADKCHLLVNVKDEVSMEIGDFNIVNSEYARSFRVLSLITSLLLTAMYQTLVKCCTIPCYMLHAELPIHEHFETSYFNECFFQIRLHVRCLRVIYNDKASSLENLLKKDGSVSIHNRNLQFLATGMFKINRGISSSIMKGIFEPETVYLTFSYHKTLRVNF